MPGGLEQSHLILALSRWLMRDLYSIVLVSQAEIGGRGS